MKSGKFFYSATIKTYQWNPDKNEIEIGVTKVEKPWPEEDIKKYRLDYIITILFASFLLSGLGCLGLAFNEIIGLCCSIGILLVTLAIGFIKYFLDLKKDHIYDLGGEDGWIEDTRLKKIFAEEIEKENKYRIKQEAKAKRWRKKNPLEEMIRIALETKDSRAIADLIRYCIDVKGELTPPPPEEDKGKIIVKYLDN